MPNTSSAKFGKRLKAIREHFLDEFDIEEPSHPIVEQGARRKRKPMEGSSGR